jgi:hypothetical protein
VQRRVLLLPDELFKHVSLELNTACNRRCWYCPNSRFDRGLPSKGQYMSFDLYAKIVSELAEMDTVKSFIPSLYGEPLLDDRLVAKVAYFKRFLPNVPVTIHTNGDLLSLTKYQHFIKAGVTKLVLSEHSKSALCRLYEITQFNQSQFINGIEIDLRIFREDGILFNRGGLIGTGQEIGFTKTTYCSEPSNSLTVDYAGNVIICCHDYHSRVIFGNLKSQSVLQI